MDLQSIKVLFLSNGLINNKYRIFIVSKLKVNYYSYNMYTVDFIPSP